MGRPPAPGVLLPADQAAACNIGQRHRLAVAQGHIKVLPPASPGAGKQCRHDAVACVQARRQIGHRHANLDRRAVPAARDMHQTKLGLHHDIVTRPLGVGPRLAVPCDGRVDQGRVDLVDGLEVEPVLLECTGDVVLNQNVALGGQFMEDVDSCGILVGQSQRLFVAVYLSRVSGVVTSCLLTGGLTARKYADSPGPSCDEPALYGAYGGPHARVSSPLTGCSILMTSALANVSHGACCNP